MGIDHKEFDNQEEVDAAERELQTVVPHSHLGQWGMNGNRCICVGVTLREKGNKEVFQKLKAMGWHKVFRKKVGGRWGEKSYRVTMEKNLH